MRRSARLNGILSQHDYRNECVTQAGDSRYEYDGCGRVTKRTEQKRGFRPQEWCYRWDDFDRLREVKTPDVVTIDKDNSAANRAKSLKGIPTKPGKDRDEWPMAMFKEGGLVLMLSIYHQVIIEVQDLRLDML